MKTIVLFFTVVLFVMVNVAFAGVPFNTVADLEPCPLPGITAFDAEGDAYVLLAAGEEADPDVDADQVDDEDENEAEGEGLQGGGGNND